MVLAVEAAHAFVEAAVPKLLSQGELFLVGGLPSIYKLRVRLYMLGVVIWLSTGAIYCSVTIAFDAGGNQRL